MTAQEGGETVPVEDAPDHGTTSSTELTIVTIVLQQLTLMEARLGARIDKIDASAAGRWVAHATEHDEIERLLKDVAHRLDAHLQDERDDELVMQARIDPVKRLLGWCAREWRTLAIVALLLLDFIATADKLFRNLIP